MNIQPQNFWDEDWFVNLPSKYKLFWIFICDQCSDTLHWKPNKLLFEKIINEPIDFNEFLGLVNATRSRIEVKSSDWWFIKEIQDHQS